MKPHLIYALASLSLALALPSPVALAAQSNDCAHPNCICFIADGGPVGDLEFGECLIDEGGDNRCYRL